MNSWDSQCERTSDILTKCGRKRRIVKNPDIGIEDVVNIDAGKNYSNWILIAKRKLIEREEKLFYRRMDIIQNIISQQMKLFQTNLNEQLLSNSELVFDIYAVSNVLNQNYSINTICLQKLRILLNEWAGIDLNHRKKSLPTFREYFCISRAWFDSKKKKTLAVNYWIPIFNMLIKLTDDIGKKYFQQTGQCIIKSKSKKYYLCQIVLELFRSRIQYPASKPRQLISFTAIRDSPQLKKYLIMQIDESLNFYNLALKKNHKRKMKATKSMTLIMELLKNLCEKTKKEFDFEVAQYIKNKVDEQQNEPEISIDSKSDNNNNNNNNNNQCIDDESCESVIAYRSILSIDFNESSMKYIQNVKDIKNGWNNCNLNLNLPDIEKNGFNQLEAPCTQEILFNNNNNNNIMSIDTNNDNNSYNGYHGPSQRVSSSRYNPFI